MSIYKTGFSFHLVSQGLQFAAGARVQVHELVAVDQQGRLFALVLVLEGCETPALHLQNTGQVPDVALKGQEASPDLSWGGGRRSTKSRHNDHIVFMWEHGCTFFPPAIFVRNLTRISQVTSFPR